MRILFISSGNNKFGISPFIKSQGESLKALKVDVSYFAIENKSIKGYIKAGIKLRRFLKFNHYDIIHAHYTFSGWAAIIGARKIPVVLSLMGSDAYGDYIAPYKVKFTSKYNIILTYLIQFFIKKIISKSKNIEKYVWQKNKSVIIPNGINTDTFLPLKKDCKLELGLRKDIRYILFIGDKKNKRKNYKLVEDAFTFINPKNIELLAPYPISPDKIPKYLNSVDVLIISSLAEGSPNIVKEAMACNCPIVATDVGDIRWLFGQEPGHFIVNFDPQDVADKIKLALKYVEERKRTNGRQRILELGLDINTIAQRILNVYKSVINNEK